MPSQRRSGLSASLVPTPVRFLMAGGIAALVNFGSRILLSRWLAYGAAIVVAYCVGMATAFVLNRRFVFRDTTNRLHEQAIWFVSINILALLQTLAVSVLLARFVLPAAGVGWHAEEISHAVGIAVPIVTSYLGHKHWTFRND
jgi:putative flippase GtrA